MRAASSIRGRAQPCNSIRMDLSVKRQACGIMYMRMGKVIREVKVATQAGDDPRGSDRGSACHERIGLERDVIAVVVTACWL